MIVEKSAGGIIVNNGKIILIKQAPTNTWSFPKGHINDGEESLEAARREIHEETGITDLSLIGNIGSYTRESRVKRKVRKNITLFLFKTNETKLNPIDSDNPKAVWVDIEDVQNVLSYEEEKRFFLDIKGRIKDVS